MSTLTTAERLAHIEEKINSMVETLKNMNKALERVSFIQLEAQAEVQATKHTLSAHALELSRTAEKLQNHDLAIHNSQKKAWINSGFIAGAGAVLSILLSLVIAMLQ